MYESIQMLTNMSVLAGWESVHATSAMRCTDSSSAVKKSLQHPRADETAKARFQQKITAYQAARRAIVYLDESGFAHDMPRTHGYAPRGQRCFGVRDWQAKGRTNVLGACLDHQLLTTCLDNTSVDSEVFYAWVTQDLLPKLPPNAVIVMDNAAFHKRQDIAKRI